MSILEFKRANDRRHLSRAERVGSRDPECALLCLKIRATETLHTIHRLRNVRNIANRELASAESLYQELTRQIAERESA